MRKLLFTAAIALVGTLGLAACSHHEPEATSAQAKATRPTTADVDAAVKACQAKHPEAAQASAPASTSTTAPSASASASAQNAAPSLASGDEENNPCVRANIAFSTWQPYLQDIVEANMGGISNTPFVYFVPSSKYPQNQGAIGRVQQQVNDSVAATVLPGNMVAAVGPDSATTAQVLETAFKNASAGSFKGVVVLFIGDQADEAAVKAAVEPSGATFKFAQI